MSTLIKEALKVAQVHTDARDMLGNTLEYVIVLFLSDAVELLLSEKEELKKALRVRSEP